jgi:hypothetical protein
MTGLTLLSQGFFLPHSTGRSLALVLYGRAEIVSYVSTVDEVNYRLKP